MKIQILGTGCPKCRQLTQVAQDAADHLGLEYELEKITDIGDITRFGVMMTPALAVDGQVKVVGAVPKLDDVIKMLQ